MKIILLKSALICCGICGQLQAAVFNGVYADTNNVILPGYTFYATNLADRITTNQLPVSAVLTSQLAQYVGTNQFALSNTAILTQLSQRVGTNDFALTNTAVLLQLAQRVGTNQFALTNTAVLTQLAQRTGTNDFALTNTAVLLQLAQRVGTNDFALTNAAVLAQLAAATNITRAFTVVLPATTDTAVISLTPNLPDANYSIALLPQDTYTAGAALAGMTWWADTKTSSAFTLHVPFSTNAFNLNFDCLIHANTQ